MADLSISIDINATGTKRGAAEAVRSVDTITTAAMKLKERMSGINFAAIGKRIQDFGNRIKDVGGQLQSVGTTLTGIFTVPLAALATLGVRSALELDKARTKLTALVGSTEAANKKIAELRALADSSVGVTRAAAIETFSQLKGIGGVAEESINRMIVAMGKLNAAFNIDDQAGFMRNLTQIFSQGFERADVKEAIGRVPFFEQLLEQAFGTSDPEKLNALKAAGSLTMDTFMSGMAEAIQKDQRVANIGENLTTKMAKAFERMNDALAPLGDVILDIVVPAIEAVGPYIDKLGKWFAELSPEAKTAAVAVAAVAAAIGPLLFTLGGVVIGIGGFVFALGTIIASAKLVGIAILVVIGLIGQMAIPLALIGTEVYLLYKAWETNFAGIRDFTAEVATAIQNAWNAALTEISSFTQSLLAQINEFWLKHGDEIKEALAIIEAAIREKLEAIRAFWNEHGGQITEIVTTIWNAIKVTVKLGLDIILQAIRAVAALIRGDWKTFWDATAQILKNIVDIWVGIMLAAGKTLLEAVKAIFVGVFALRAWIEAEAIALGKALVLGIIKGIVSHQFAVVDAAVGVVRRAINAMKSEAQTQSPSKVTTEIGKDIADGLAVGMDSGAGEVAKTARDLSTQIMGIFGGDINGFLRNAFDVLTDGSKSWGDRLKTIFGGIARNFRDMVTNMASNWLNSLFGGGNGQGPGGTPTFAGGSGGGFGGFRMPGDRTGTIDAAGNFVVDGRSGFKKFTGPGGFFGEQGFGNNVGTYGAIGGIASTVGGAIGGRAGGFISNIGSGVALGAQIGSIIPGIGTAIGAAIGGVVGFFSSLFGGDPKRKRDKNEKIPALNRGFTDALKELRDLVGDVRTLRVSPDSAIARATELRNQIASGFGLEFESKKYRKQARTLITQRTREADALIAELRNAAEIANAAGERQRRLIPEFATGVFMSRDFTKQFGDFKRMNGMMAGRYSGIDSINARIGAGEMVLNPRQQQNVRSNAGLDPFRNAGIPGYAGGGAVGGGQSAVGSAEPMNMTFVFEHSIDADGMVRTSLKNNPDVKREVRVVVEDLAENDRLKLKRRGL